MSTAGRIVTRTVSSADREVMVLEDRVKIVRAGFAGRQGEQGIQGIQGPPGQDGPVFQGDWDPDETYTPQDAVHYAGSLWVCTAAPPAHQAPPDPNYWGLAAARGEKGETGDEGPQGPMGSSVGLPFSWGGVWDDAESYEEYTLVGLDRGDGSTARDVWIVLPTVTTTAGERPDETPAEWQLWMRGPKGAGFRWRGAWEATDDYQRLDVARYAGTSWVCTVASIEGDEDNDPPNADASRWDPLAQKGAKGDPGDPGADGADGVDGVNGTDGSDGEDGEDGADAITWAPFEWIEDRAYRMLAGSAAQFTGVEVLASDAGEITIAVNGVDVAGPLGDGTHSLSITIAARDVVSVTAEGIPIDEYLLATLNGRSV